MAISAIFVLNYADGASTLKIRRKVGVLGILENRISNTLCLAKGEAEAEVVMLPKFDNDISREYGALLFLILMLYEGLLLILLVIGPLKNLLGL